MALKELDVEFVKKGELFTQVEKSDNYYIYKRNVETCVYFEVFERRVAKVNDFWRQYDTKGKYEGYDSFEQYPNDESFGKWAYCCNSLERAKMRALEFVNNK